MGPLLFQASLANGHSLNGGLDGMRMTALGCRCSRCAEELGCFLVLQKTCELPPLRVMANIRFDTT